MILQPTKSVVFVDMAWFGTCKGIDIDITFFEIQEINLTTKGLCTGNYRSGIRFPRHGTIEYDP